jgi:hypothetical protein
MVVRGRRAANITFRTNLAANAQRYNSLIPPPAREWDHVAVRGLDHHLGQCSRIELQIGKGLGHALTLQLLIISSITFIRRAALAVSSVI